MFEAEVQALEDHPMIPLYFYSGRRLIRPYVKGWIDNARGVYPSRWLSIEHYGYFLLYFNALWSLVRGIRGAEKMARSMAVFACWNCIRLGKKRIL